MTTPILLKDQEVFSDEEQTNITVGWHIVRVVAEEFGGDDGTGITVQSYNDANDFGDRGWNAPRHSFSYFFPHEFSNETPTNLWGLEKLIADVPLWDGATLDAI